MAYYSINAHLTPRVVHTWYRMQGCVAHQDIKSGSRVGVGLTRSIIGPLLPSLFPVKGASKYRPHGSETPVARTGHHLWLRPGWKILPTRIGYCSNTNYVRRFR